MTGTDNKEDRPARLDTMRARFQRNEKGQEQAQVLPQPAPEKAASNRHRHTLYLDRDLVRQMDTAYKVAAHALFPLEFDKSDFLEQCFRFALAHQEEIKAALVKGLEKR